VIFSLISSYFLMNSNIIVGFPWTAYIQHGEGTRQSLGVLTQMDLGMGTSTGYIRWEHLWYPKYHGIVDVVCHMFKSTIICQVLFSKPAQWMCFLLLPGVCQFLTKRGIRRIPEIKTSRIMVALQPVYREPFWGPLQWSSCSKSSFERLTIAK
jgi:hypothetical protein